MQAKEKRTTLKIKDDMGRTTPIAKKPLKLIRLPQTLLPRTFQMKVVQRAIKATTHKRKVTLSAQKRVHFRINMTKTPLREKKVAEKEGKGKRTQKRKKKGSRDTRGQLRKVPEWKAKIEETKTTVRQKHVADQEVKQHKQLK